MPHSFQRKTWTFICFGLKKHVDFHMILYLKRGLKMCLQLMSFHLYFGKMQGFFTYKICYNIFVRCGNWLNWSIRICSRAAHRPWSEKATTTTATVFGSKTLRWVSGSDICPVAELLACYYSGCMTLPCLPHLTLLTLPFLSYLIELTYLHTLPYFVSPYPPTLPYLTFVASSCLIFLTLTYLPHLTFTLWTMGNNLAWLL